MHGCTVLDAILYTIGALLPLRIHINIIMVHVQVYSGRISVYSIQVPIMYVAIATGIMLALYARR